MVREEGNLNINEIIKKSENNEKKKDLKEGNSSGNETSPCSTKEMAQVSA